MRADATGSRRCPTTDRKLTINYACHSDHRVLAVYRPLHSGAFDLFYHCPIRFGTQPVPMNNILQETLKSKANGPRPVSVALIADQTPPWHEIKHWYRFLGQDTPFFSGVEKMAVAVEKCRSLHVCPVKPRRSITKRNCNESTTAKEAVAPHEITERYISRLEAMIRETPELWILVAPTVET